MNSATTPITALEMAAENAGPGQVEANDALDKLARAFEMDWAAAPAVDSTPSKWLMGQTLWFAIGVSAALWAAIIAIISLI